MNAVVFLGPTLPRADAAAVLDAAFLPPARQGDVFRAVRTHRPRAIGLIDGVFLDVPAVWHREILWALSEGVHVFGAASMGALRAAELATFGMRGVGAIFAAYQAGSWPGDDARFEDDDEVAVIHAPAEAGGVALSDAMVDLRASLAAADAAGVIDAAGRGALVAAMKSLHFPARSFTRLAQEARAILGEAAAARLSDWLVGNRVAQKRLDAIAMLQEVARLLARDPPPFQAPFRFERALVWEQFVRAASAPDEADTLVLEELLLDPPARLAAERAALGRMAAPIAPPDIAATLDRFRARQGLWSRADLDAWMQRNALDTAALERILQREAALDEAARQGGPELHAAMLEHLRLTGQFSKLLERARAKQAALADAAATPPAGPAMAAVLDWYFTASAGRTPAPLGRGLGARTWLGGRKSLYAGGLARLSVRGGHAMTAARETPARATAPTGGTRFRLFPAYAAGYAEPETVEVSPRPGTIGPGPSDPWMYAVHPLRKDAPYDPPQTMPPYRGRRTALPQWGRIFAHDDRQ